MLGALTWQATVIKMFLLCLRGEIARGLSYFSPGFSLLRPGLLLSSPYSPLGLHGTRSTIANLTWGYSATDKGSTIHLPRGTDMELKQFGRNTLMAAFSSVYWLICAARLFWTSVATWYATNSGWCVVALRNHGQSTKDEDGC